MLQQETKKDPAILFLGIYPRKYKTLIQKDIWILMLLAALFIIIYRQDMEITKVSFDRQVNKEDMVHTYNVLLMWTPASRVRGLWMRRTNAHGLQKSCGEKGTAQPLSERESTSTLAWTGFYCFLVALHQRRISFIILRFTLSDYFL